MAVDCICPQQQPNASRQAAKNILEIASEGWFAQQGHSLLSLNLHSLGCSRHYLSTAHLTVGSDT